MQVVEKLIVNRNNYHFFYVEKLEGAFNNIQYHLYYNKNKFQALSVETFARIFGNDEQYHVNDFIEYLKTDLLCNNDDNRKWLIINDLDNLNSKIKIFGRFNPSLYGYRNSLLTAIDVYNDIISQRPKDEEHNYTEDLMKIYSLPDKERVRE